jgi:putative oxidoreductase
MNWFGNQAGEGIEFHVLAIAIALAVILRGSGALSVDATFQAGGSCVTT